MLGSVIGAGIGLTGELRILPHRIALYYTISYSSNGSPPGKVGFGDGIEFSVEKRLRDRNG